MAKPIRATPKLNRKETDTFLQEMIKVERSRIPKKEKILAQKICKEFNC